MKSNIWYSVFCDGPRDGVNSTLIVICTQNNYLELKGRRKEKEKNIAEMTGFSTGESVVKNTGYPAYVQMRNCTFQKYYNKEIKSQ